MKRITIELDFNQLTGQSRILVDINDDSMTTFEINQSIKDGEMISEVIDQIGKIFGDPLAQKARDGEIELVCLDNNPHLKPDSGATLIKVEEQSRKEIKQ